MNIVSSTCDTNVLAFGGKGPAASSGCESDHW
jgi:hypothetical protein